MTLRMHVMRSLWLAAGLALAVALLCGPAASADSNIFTEDLAKAKRDVARTERRLETARRDAATAEQALPAARAHARPLRRTADRLTADALAADAQAQSQEDAVTSSRARARSRITAAKRSLSTQVSNWRSGRRLAVSAAAVGLALVIAALLLLVALRLRERISDSDHRAAWLAGALGAVIAVCLVGLIAALQWADAWQPDWPPIAAAAAIIALPAAATAAGWRAPQRLLQRRHAVTSLGVFAAAVSIAPVALAATSDRPRPPHLPAHVLSLAYAANTHAPMPAPVRRLRSIADALDGRAADASDRALRAEASVERYVSLKSDAQRRHAAAARSLREQTARLDDVQRDYDDYAALLAPTPDAPDSLPDLSTRDLDLPDLGPPTTEDFGQGSGSVGVCADGTLSDSIGRPGACSHHGGVP